MWIYPPGGMRPHTLQAPRPGVLDALLLVQGSQTQLLTDSSLITTQMASPGGATWDLSGQANTAHSSTVGLEWVRDLT